MKIISDKESVVANTLNEKRLKAYIDIYKETDFAGIGILIDEELNVYKYVWNIGFSKETHSFGNNNYLYKCNNKVKYEDLETYLIKDINIIEKEYPNNSDDNERFNEIVRLKNYVNEFFNKELYELIFNKIKELTEEDLWKY